MMLTRQFRRFFSSSPVLSAKKALVIAEHNNKSIIDSSLPTITAAAKLGEVNVLVAGKDCKEVLSIASFC